jgi:hypothetical protein
MRSARIDVASYGRGLIELFKHPSILAMPLLAALVDMLVSYWGGAVTDPLGGAGSGLLAMLVQIVYLFAFGIALIQARDILRGYRGGFDAAWEEGRRKASGIILAAIGFQFLAWIAVYIGSVIGQPLISQVLQLVVYFFLILVMPAAAIGGAPGGMAISMSFRAVRANVAPCLVLALVFAVLFVGIPKVLVIAVGAYGLVPFLLARAAATAVMFAYLAFPFAALYDEIGFRPW